MADVIVGVDGSAESATALEWAADAAAQRGSPLRIIYALHMPLVVMPFDRTVPLPPSDDLRDRAEALLKHAQEQAEHHVPGLQVRTELSLRPATPTLLSASEDADLVVVGSRGLGMFGSVFLGSVSTRVAARASCPTVVVREGSSSPNADGPVLVGVDGSVHGAAAMRFALREAKLRDAPVIALTVYSGPEYVVTLHDAKLAQRIDDDARRDATRLVADVLEQAREDDTANVDVETRAVPGHPPTVLADAGREAALTVVGSRGRGGFRGMLLGSVSLAVLHHATHPVAVVRATDGD